MNKLELTTHLSDQLDIPIEKAERAVSIIFGDRTGPGLLESVVTAGERFVIQGFGRFEIRERQGRPGGKNIATGERMIVSGRRAIRFIPARRLSKRVA